ncbi:MAG: hypothetical protein JW744_00795 [Candidatus Diapherotrites archaeon]|uniref:Uncharacterized protein n=1 Tax=Candidatus Iainarchaeum sp. TaxID=3101447 RepID=A0A938YS03_9ARCH|nr:hypothetical protein [Candidatus Diapherotrites archaeon]
MEFKKIIAVISTLAGGMLFFVATRAENSFISNALVWAGLILLLLGVLESVYVFGRKSS